MRLRNNLLRLVSALKGEAIYLYCTRFGAILLQSVTLFVVAAVIGIEEFGRFTFMYSAAQIVTVVLNVGSPLFLQRTLPARDVSHGGAGNANIVATCVTRTVAAASFSLLALLWIDLLLYGSINLFTGGEALLILLTGFVLSVLHIFIAVSRVAKSATYSMLLRDLVPYAVFLIGLGICLLLGIRSAEVTILLFAVAVSLSAIVAGFSSVRYLAARVSKKKVDFTESGRSMIFWGSSITGAGLTQVDILLARVFLDDMALGIYSLLRRVSNLISMPQVIANWTINVKVAKDFERKDKKALQDHATQGLFLSFPVALAMFLLIAVSSPLWLGMFDISPGAEVIELLLVLLLAQLVNVMSGANSLYAVQCKEEMYIFKVRLMTLVFSAVAMSIGAVIFGSIGVALGTLLGMIVLNGMLLYHIKKRIGVWTSIPLRFFLRS